MKLVVFVLSGIIAVILLVVVVLFFLFCSKNRKRDAEVREHNENPMHHDSRKTSPGLHPPSKMNSGLMTSLEVTDERGVSVGSSGAHSPDLSEHTCSDPQITTDAMKREMLQDPNVTAENIEKVQKELAKKGNLFRKSEKVAAAENEEEGNLLEEFDHLYERK